MMTRTDASGSAGDSTSADPGRAPLTLELLAELHAGVFDEPLAAQLRRRVTADPQAAAMLAALDATVADLAALPHQRTAPIPESVARRLDTALAAERANPNPPPETGFAGAAVPPALVADMTVALRKRHRAGWAGGAILAAAAAVLGMVVLSGLSLETAGDVLGTAIGIQSSEPPTLVPADHASLHSALDQALQTPDYGPLSAPERLRNCLAAHGGGAPLGALEVTLEGRRGVLLVLPTDRPEQIRLLVVGPSCTSADPSRLADHLLTR